MLFFGAPVPHNLIPILLRTYPNYIKIFLYFDYPCFLGTIL